MHKVLITQFAKDNLNFIHSYYKSTASIAVADKIKSEIKTLKDDHCCPIKIQINPLTF